MILDLQLNEQLVPRGHFLSYQLPNGAGKAVERYNRSEQVELCHYRVILCGFSKYDRLTGLIQFQGKIRDKPESSVALSTCHGVRGVVYDGHETYYIESDVSIGDVPSSIDLADHYVYR